jgi:hypothetical protein
MLVLLACCLAFRTVFVIDPLLGAQGAEIISSIQNFSRYYLALGGTEPREIAIVYDGYVAVLYYRVFNRVASRQS